MSEEQADSGDGLCLFFVIGFIIGIVIFILLLNIEGPTPPQF